MKRAPAVAVLLLVGGSALLAGCANKGAVTQEFYPPADGVNAQSGDIAIRHVMAVQSEEGAWVLATFVPATEPDALIGVTIDGQEATLSPSAVELPPGAAVTVGTGEVSAAVPGLELELGGVTEVTFTFEDAAGTSVEALVRDPEDVYGGGGPRPSATVFPAATPTTTPTG